MKQIRLLFLIGFLCCAVSALGQKVSFDYDKGADFSKYKTYAWTVGTPVGGKTLDMYITQAIDHEMEAKGMQRIETPKDADLLITYHASGTGEVNVTLFADPTYIMTGGVAPVGMSVWSTGYAISATTRLIRKGMLAIEFFDVKNHGLVWIGTAKVTLEETQNKRLDQLDKSLDKLFAQYPPKKK